MKRLIDKIWWWNWGRKMRKARLADLAEQARLLDNRIYNHRNMPSDTVELVRRHALVPMYCTLQTQGLI